MDITIEKAAFGSAQGRAAHICTLKSGGFGASFCDLGCTLVSFTEPGGRDIVLGYGRAEDYLAGSSCLGATVGRYAGRIGGAGFTLGGARYELERNDGPNHLHGGFPKRFFKVRGARGGLIFTLVSPDGDEAFPGELTLRVLVTLTGGRLRMEYRASADAPTPVNITNHSYFNLGGATVGGHLLRVCSDEYLETGEGLIPTGRRLKTAGTPLDHAEPTALSAAISSPLLKGTRGLDHSFPLPGEGLREAARLCCPESGLGLVCRTTQPTIHVYTAGFLHLDSVGVGKNGAPLVSHGGVCLEAQHAPNSPNIPAFPSTVLAPGRELREIVEYEIVRA